MKLLRLMLIVCAIGVSANSYAGTVMGMPSCGKWVEERAKDSQQSELYKTWIYGYLSGLANQSRLNFLNSADAATINLWLDRYCNENPLEQLGDGGDKLAKELIKRMHK